MNEKERKELIEAFENDLAVDSNRINMSIFIIVCIMLYLWYRGWVASILGIVDDHTGERAVYAITMLPTIYLFTIGMGCYYKLGGPSLMGYIILKTGITGRVSKGYQKGKGSYKLSSGKTYYIEVLKCSNLIRGWHDDCYIEFGKFKEPVTTGEYQHYESDVCNTEKLTYLIKEVNSVQSGFYTTYSIAPKDRLIT